MRRLHLLAERVGHAEPTAKGPDHRGQHGDLFPQVLRPVPGRIPQRRGADAGIGQCHLGPAAARK